MIKHDIFRENTDLVLTYSDTNHYIVNNQGVRYEQALDLKTLIDNGTIVYTESEDIILTEESFVKAKEDKINEFKAKRDEEESSPISVDGVMYDFDDKARDRINGAIISLEFQGANGSLEWTTADNDTVVVDANKLKAVIVQAAVRANELHIKYRELMAQVEACESIEGVNNIKW